MPSQLEIESITGNEEAGITTLVCRYILEDGVVQRFEVQNSLSNPHHVFIIDENDVRTLAYTYSGKNIEIPVMFSNVSGFINFDLTKENLALADADLQLLGGIDLIIEEEMEGEPLIVRAAVQHTLLVLPKRYFYNVVKSHLDVTIPTAKDFFRLFFQECRVKDKEEKEAAEALAAEKEQEQAALRAALLAEDAEEKKKSKKPAGKKSAAQIEKQNLALAALQKKTNKACRELEALSVSMGGFSPTTRAKKIKETLAKAQESFENAIDDASKDASLLAGLSAAKANFDEAYQTFLLRSETPTARAERVAEYRAQDDNFNISVGYDKFKKYVDESRDDAIQTTRSSRNLFSLFAVSCCYVETDDEILLFARFFSRVERKCREEAIARGFMSKDMAV